MQPSTQEDAADSPSIKEKHRMDSDTELAAKKSTSITKVVEVDANTLYTDESALLGLHVKVGDIRLPDYT